MYSSSLVNKKVGKVSKFIFEYFEFINLYNLSKSDNFFLALISTLNLSFEYIFNEHKYKLLEKNLEI